MIAHTNRIVVGWHTTDAKYTALARSLAAQLEAVGQCHRLYAVERPHGEDWQKTIVYVRSRITLKATQDHPDAQILFLDVDALVAGSLEPLFRQLAHCDVAIAFRTKRRCGRRSAKLHPIGGVFLVNPTDNARRFVRQWVAACDRAAPGESEESALAAVLAFDRVDATIGIIPPSHACLDADMAPSGAVITHASAHRSDLPTWKRAEQMLRAVFRRVVPRDRAGNLGGTT